MDSFLECKNIPKLDEKQKEICDRKIDETEILKSLKYLHNGKTPGTDGLPTDFYKFFWIDIKSLLVQSIDFAMSHGELSIEQK